ncbi:MAG: prolyl oligopeptidase family serine peptidase [Candidatus Neomarinimicrobiota bacterium]|jgi:poly(3-hydroxybutyrate) depolymerase
MYKHNRHYLITAITLIIIWLATTAKSVQNTGKANLPDGYTEHYHNDLRYGLFIPPFYDSNRSYPLVIYLHGSTDTTSWDLGWYHDPLLSQDPCIVLTPKSLVKKGGWGTNWQRKHTPDMLKTLQIIAMIRDKYNIDSDRIYICGVSMGGYGTISALSKEPNLFAAGYSICGGGNARNVKRLANIPLWLFHGSDDEVVSVNNSRNIYKAVKKAGGKQIRYTEYRGVGHAAWEPAGKEPSLSYWLLAQRKGAQHGIPDTVQNLQCEIVGNNVKLVWKLPSDEQNPDNRIWYCRIYRDGELIAEVDNIYTTYIDSLNAAGKHDYSVSVVNYYFKESLKTSPVVVDFTLLKP